MTNYKLKKFIIMLLEEKNIEVNSVKIRNYNKNTLKADKIIISCNYFGYDTLHDIKEIFEVIQDKFGITFNKMLLEL